MKPPVASRLLAEDFQDAPSWLSRLFSTLNRFMEQTIAVLDGGISFGDNILARRFSTSFTTTGTYVDGDFLPISFSWIAPVLPLAVLVVQVINSDGTPFLGSVGTPQWRYSNGAINITYIPGLDNNVKYNVSFLAF
jgi:hypothetical protein